MENEMLLIAKIDEEALAILSDLQNEGIIDAYDEEYVECDSKHGALLFLEKGILYADAIYFNGSFDDDEEIVDKCIANLDKYMADDDHLYAFEYEAA